jgi:tetratricopeptide (TPR) repeat protein
VHVVDQAVKTFGNGDDETLTVLAAWLYARQEYEAALKVVPMERATRNRELFIQRVDALAALGRYQQLQEMLLSEQSVIDPSMQHMFLAVVRSKLGETVAGDNEWERALDEADSLPKLLTLADYAEKNGAFGTADAAYGRAISKEPGIRYAYHARLRLAETLGETDKAHRLAKEIVRLWPDETETRIREIYLRLLLDTSAATGRTAEKEVAAIVAKNPWNKAAATTLSLARLRQGRIAAALEAAPQPGPDVPPSPPLALAWAENGWKDLAREEVKKLATVKLLPEERALISGLGGEQ